MQEPLILVCLDMCEKWTYLSLVNLYTVIIFIHSTHILFKAKVFFPVKIFKRNILDVRPDGKNIYNNSAKPNKSVNIQRKNKL